MKLFEYIFNKNGENKNGDKLIVNVSLPENNEIVWNGYIRNRYPYIITQTSKYIIPSLSKCIPQIEIDQDISTEHCGIIFDNNHNRYSNQELIGNMSVKILKFKGKNNFAMLNNVYCINIDDDDDSKLNFIHTYMRCHSDYSNNSIKIFLNQDVDEIDGDFICVNCPWSDGFQHSIQDMLPRILAVTEWLHTHTDVSIVLPYNSDLMWFINNIFKEKIKNRIIFTQKHIVKCKSDDCNFYNIFLDPLHRCESVPYSLYLNMELVTNITEDKYLIIFDRSNCEFRTIDNNLLINIVDMYLKQINSKLEIKLIDPSIYDKKYIINLMKDCQGVIAPHGGANYNVLFMRRTHYSIDKKRFFIELITNKYMHHTYHIALGANIRYKPIICQGDHYTKEMTFSESDILNALKFFLN